SESRQDRLRTADCTRRSIESRKNAVARELDPVTVVALKLASNQVVMTIEELVPTRVPEFGLFSCGVHEVGEDDSREQPVNFDSWPGSCQELLDLVEHLVGVVGIERTVSTRDQSHGRLRDVIGEIPALRLRFLRSLQTV